MRKRTCFYVVGGIATGFAAYCIYKHFKKKNDMESMDVEDTSRDPFVAPVYSPTEAAPQQTVISDFEQVQRHAAESIRKNHVDAARQLGEVIETVASNSTEVKEANNQAQKDLDELMK